MLISLESPCPTAIESLHGVCYWCGGDVVFCWRLGALAAEVFFGHWVVWWEGWRVLTLAVSAEAGCQRTTLFSSSIWRSLVGVVLLYAEEPGGHSKDHSAVSSSSSSLHQGEVFLDVCETSFVREGGQERRELRLAILCTIWFHASVL